MSLQAIGALGLSVHHASIVTLQATPAYKLIENQMLPQNCAHSVRSCRPLGPLLDPSVECCELIGLDAISRTLLLPAPASAGVLFRYLDRQRFWTPDWIPCHNIPSNCLKSLVTPTGLEPVFSP